MSVPDVPLTSVGLVKAYPNSLELSAEITTESGSPFTSATFELYNSNTLNINDRLGLNKIGFAIDNRYSTTFTSLYVDTEYWVRWFLSNENGDGSPSSLKDYKTTVSPPSVPASLVTIKNSTETSLEVYGDFTETDGAPFSSVTFELYDSNINGVLLESQKLYESSLGVFTAEFLSLTPNKPYWIKWFLSNPGGDGPASELESFRTSASGGPSALAIGSVSDITSSGFNVTFTGGDGEDVTYSASALELASNDNAVIGTVNAGSKTISFTGLKSSTRYSIILTATNAGGTTHLSPAATLDINESEFTTAAVANPTLPAPVFVSKTSRTITVTGNITGVSGGPFRGLAFFIGTSGNERFDDKIESTENNGIYTHVFSGLDPSILYDMSWSLIKSDDSAIQSSILLGIRTNADGNPVCFVRGSRILCLNEGLKEEYMAIEDMRVGTRVKTLNGSFVKVHTIGYTMFNNPDNADRGPNRLFKLSPENYPELTEDLIITGCHSRLVDKLEPKQKARHLQLMKSLYMTTGKFRLMAFIDEKAEPYQKPGPHEIWHFALENEEEVCNYGVYANGGLLVETASIKNMRERSGFALIE
jgi:hypothetical protein